MPAATNTIDMTPTWESVLDLLLSSHQNKNACIRDTAYTELTRMAKTADAYVASLKQLPEPPPIIKVNEDFTHGLDLRNPIHAEAYLKAASHFLSSWPQEWSAETLCLALLAEDEDDENFANQKEIFPWDAIEKSSSFQTEGGNLFLEQIINSLAEDFVKFRG